MSSYNGLGLHLGNLSRLSSAISRSLSPENPTGEPGRGAMADPNQSWNAARELGKGWKASPNIGIPAGETRTIADIQGPGAIQQIWMTLTGNWRHTILRIYWDGSETPSVECPTGDFFACGWGKYAQVSSLPVCVNPGCAFNCYWEMPFRKNCRITMTNLADQQMTLFYQINYTLTDVPEECAYFHAQFRRVNPTPYKQPYTILDGVSGQGHYVGTYMAWGSNTIGWWGEGEIKFYLDDDGEYPTICGTGTEDYFCGSYNFDPGVLDKSRPNAYHEFTTPHAGMPQVIRPNGVYDSQMRFGLYRWHIMDPIRFKKNLRVTIQALGWQGGGRFKPLQDDLASVAYWYQTLPAPIFPPLPHRDQLDYG